MKLELNGIEVECVIGEREDERDRLQRLRIDVVMDIPDDAAETDALEDTVDYAELTETIRAELIAAKCRMIERAAYLVAVVCKSDSLRYGARHEVRRNPASSFRIGGIFALI